MDSPLKAADLLMEDYRLWLQELQKQDRWFAEVVWVVLAGTAAGMASVSQIKTLDPAAGILLVAFIGLVFVSINADFLATRIVSYRQVARRVAAARAALGVEKLLALTPDLEEAGSPMLSAHPTAFARTAHTGRVRGGGFRQLYLAQLIALGTIYVVLPFVLQPALAARDPWLAEEALYALGSIAVAHIGFFALTFRWRISEATSWGQFLITVARDHRVRVSPKAEHTLHQWFSRSPAWPSDIHKQPAIRVMIFYEDKRFLSLLHWGVDPISIAALVLRRRRGGATTIPMQLARQLLSRVDSGGYWQQLKRKTFEAVLGSYLVVRKGRRFVLDAWLRSICFGRSDIVGVDQAAKQYLGKTVAEMDELDGLLLAERLTVWTGRYYLDRVPRLASWALRRGLITQSLSGEVSARQKTMIERVPGEIRRDLPGHSYEPPCS